LPPELLEDIINHVENVGDLLFMALTCRTLLEDIIPWHLEYRQISCDLGRRNVWQTLCNKPSLAYRLQNL
ncbi:hypothetical protein M422DRAFT_101157, partial [Sphaerobolus stellatus SS14]